MLIPLGYKFNDNETVVESIMNLLDVNGGYCPCCNDHNEDTKCPCRNVKEGKECHCTLFVKQ